MVVLAGVVTTVVEAETVDVAVRDNPGEY